MKKPLLLLLTLFIYSTYAYSGMTEEELSLYEGKGFFHAYVTHEYGLAEGYYKIACDGDLATACDNLATLYLNGDKTHKSKPLEALPYYIKACTLDNGYGCLMSGNLKSERIHTLKDLNETIGYYKRSCDLGYSEACHALDEDKTDLVCNKSNAVYCNTIGVRLGHARAFDRALYYYRKSCEHDIGTACSNVGFMYLNGQSVEVDLNSAKKYFEKSCDLNSSFGCENLTIVQNLLKKHDDMYTAISPLRNAKVIKNYGIFTDPIEHVEIFNDSVTLQVQGMDTKVYNVLNGKVVFVGESKTLGKVVVMLHANHLHTIYERLDKIAPYVKVGRKIKRGYVVGRVKKNLIFQVTKDSKNMNPMGFLP